MAILSGHKAVMEHLGEDRADINTQLTDWSWVRLANLLMTAMSGRKAVVRLWAENGTGVRLVVVERQAGIDMKRVNAFLWHTDAGFYTISAKTKKDLLRQAGFQDFKC